MQQVTVTYAKLAEIALAVMAQAQVKADDETLAYAIGARQMLHQIARGALLVTTPKARKV